MHQALRDTDIAKAIIHQAANTNAFLNLLEDKAPCASLNEILSSFVKVVYPFYNDCIIHSVMNDELIAKNITAFRNKLSECEFALEVYWANKIIQGQARYTDYPYMSGYAALVDSEREHLEKFTAPDGRHFCFIGAGPVPITPLELKRHYPRATMHGIEMDEQAIDYARQVSACSDCTISYTHCKAQEVDYATFDIIFVASMTMHKKDVLQQIARTAKKGTIIAIRSVDNLRCMLYEPVATEMIPENFASLGRAAYRNEQQVNVALFYRVQ